MCWTCKQFCVVLVLCRDRDAHLKSMEALKCEHSTLKTKYEELKTARQENLDQVRFM